MMVVGIIAGRCTPPVRALLPWWKAVRPVIVPTVMGMLIVSIWQFSIQWLHVLPVVLPSPGDVLSVMASNFSLLLEHGLHTLWEACAALSVSVIVGLALAIVLSASRHIRDSVFPNLVLIELVPKIALAPLFIIWLGNGDASRVIFGVFLSFFPIVLATIVGLSTTDASAIRLCHSLRATSWQIFAQIRFPYALPYIFSGVKIGSTMAMIGVIVAEFINGSHGLGYLVMFAASNMASALMFAATFLLCIFGMLLYVAVALIERLVALRYGLPKA